MALSTTAAWLGVTKTFETRFLTLSKWKVSLKPSKPRCSSSMRTLKLKSGIRSQNLTNSGVEFRGTPRLSIWKMKKNPIFCVRIILSTKTKIKSRSIILIFRKFTFWRCVAFHVDDATLRTQCHSYSAIKFTSQTWLFLRIPWSSFSSKWPTMESASTIKIECKE